MVPTYSYSPPLCRDTTGKHYGYPISCHPRQEKTVWISKTYPWADGWFAGGMTSNGEVTADVVYAGFGVTAPELGYDDYKDIDVKGKIVLVEGETPNISRNPDSLAMWYKHTLHQTKLNNAAAHGAAGLLYKWVPGPNAPIIRDLSIVMLQTLWSMIFSGEQARPIKKPSGRFIRLRSLPLSIPEREPTSK